MLTFLFSIFHAISDFTTNSQVGSSVARYHLQLAMEELDPALDGDLLLPLLIESCLWHKNSSGSGDLMRECEAR